MHHAFQTLDASSTCKPGGELSHANSRKLAAMTRMTRRHRLGEVEMVPMSVRLRAILDAAESQVVQTAVGRGVISRGDAIADAVIFAAHPRAAAQHALIAFFRAAWIFAR